MNPNAAAETSVAATPRRTITTATSACAIVAYGPCGRWPLSCADAGVSDGTDSRLHLVTRG
ncbi:hypothetical protein GCM10010466_30000 [Planomonospora alba]|uniref:Uncharacterized protein n=1 Tax=Planomonospora alba TaxID=161354 RepID=A0ABP6N6N1_9ACTN